MHPHRQTPSVRDSPRDNHPSPYGQMPPQGYVNNQFYSDMTPTNRVCGAFPTNFSPPHPSYPIPPTSSQIYRGRIANDQHQHHAMAFPGPLTPSQLSPQSLSTYSADFRQRNIAASTDNSSTRNIPQSHHGANSQNLPSRMPTSMASPYVSFSDDMLVRQECEGQDHPSLRSSSLAASTSGEASCIGTTKDNVNADESSCSDSTPLRSIAQRAGALVNPQDDDASAHQSAHQHQGAQDHMKEHHMMKRPQAGLSMSDLIEVGQKPIEEPAVGTMVIWQPVVQQSTPPQPILEPGTSERQDTEERSTSQSFLRLDSTTSGSNKDRKENFDEEKRDNETQEVTWTLQSEYELDQMDKYAFSFAREAYDHHVPQQLTKGITLHVNSLAPLATSLKQRREEVNNDITPTLLPQPNEFEKGSKTVECVWVGMLPNPAAMFQIQPKLDQTSEEGSTGGNLKPGKKRSLKKTSSVASIRDDEMKVIAFDQDALRVVAKKSDRVTKDIHIYALVQPHYTTKFQGFKVGFDEVFYFRDFRDDTAISIRRRKQATVAKIKASVFQGAAHAVSQSPAPTAEQSTNQPLHAFTALSPLSTLSSLSRMATPTPPPGNLATRKRHVDRLLRKLSAGEIIHRASSFSQLKSDKEATAEARAESRKRKAHDPVSEILLRQREEARKKAKAEGYYVPGSDSEIYESVEDDDHKSLTNHSQDCDVSMGSITDYSDNADELIGHGSSPSHDARMDISSQIDEDEEGCPEHSVRRHDPSFVNYTNDLIDQVAFEKSTTGKGPRKVSFRLQSGQMIDKHGKTVGSNSIVSEEHDGDDEGESSRTHSRMSAGLANKIRSMAQKLATDQDVVGLQQALTMIECIRHRCGPPKTSALSLHFNVSNSNDIQIEDCAEQLKQLRALFPNLDDENKVRNDILAWMVKGLQITGQSLSIDVLPHFLIAFAKQYESKFGTGPHGQKSRISRNVLVDLTCSARNKAEEALRLIAIENGADRARLEAESECPSHPYINPDEEAVYQPAFWESPEV